MALALFISRSPSEIEPLRFLARPRPYSDDVNRGLILSLAVRLLMVGSSASASTVGVSTGLAGTLGISTGLGGGGGGSSTRGADGGSGGAAACVAGAGGGGGAGRGPEPPGMNEKSSAS